MTLCSILSIGITSDGAKPDREVSTRRRNGEDGRTVDSHIPVLRFLMMALLQDALILFVFEGNVVLKSTADDDIST
jgi:hypothetical protein